MQLNFRVIHLLINSKYSGQRRRGVWMSIQATWLVNLMLNFLPSINHWPLSLLKACVFGWVPTCLGFLLRILSGISSLGIQINVLEISDGACYMPVLLLLFTWSILPADVLNLYSFSSFPPPAALLLLATLKVGMGCNANKLWFFSR